MILRTFGMGLRLCCTPCATILVDNSIVHVVATGFRSNGCGNVLAKLFVPALGRETELDVRRNRVICRLRVDNSTNIADIPADPGNSIEFRNLFTSDSVDGVTFPPSVLGKIECEGLVTEVLRAHIVTSWSRSQALLCNGLRNNVARAMWYKTALGI